MFIAALFTIPKLWKQPKCPTTAEWIKKMYLYTMEFYSATKKFCHSQLDKWNWKTSSLAMLARLRRPKIICSPSYDFWSSAWLTSSLAMLARLRRPKIICSPSYADFRPKTNAVILLDMVHMPKEEHYRGNRGKEGKLKLERV
jgi:hypothetical protein